MAKKRKRQFIEAREIPEGGHFMLKWGRLVYTRMYQMALARHDANDKAIVGIARNGYARKIGPKTPVLPMPNPDHNAVDERGKPVANGVDIMIRRSNGNISHPYWWEMAVTIGNYTGGIMSNGAFKTACEAVQDAAKAMKIHFGYGGCHG